MKKKRVADENKKKKFADRLAALNKDEENQKKII